MPQSKQTEHVAAAFLKELEALQLQAHMVNAPLEDWHARALKMTVKAFNDFSEMRHKDWMNS